MGWNIILDVNTVEINSSVALDLYNCGADICSCWEHECNFPMLDGIINDGKLVFNYDHMERMDYVRQPKVLAVLKKHRVKGDICFSSNDGYNDDRRWGYRFDGEGNMIKLKSKKGKLEEVGKIPTKKDARVAAYPKDHMNEVRKRVEIEGFDYTFRYYSDFSQVKNKEFHSLLKAYIKAADALEKFINN